MRRVAILVALLFASSACPAKSPAPPTTYRIAGVVLDSVTGQPLEGAEVSIAPVTALDQEQTFLTSTDGRFVFADLPAAKYRLTAGRRGYANQAFHQHEGYSTAIVTGHGLDSEHIRFPLAPNAVLTGVVTDESGDPAREAKVLLFHQSMSDGTQTLHMVAQTITDDQGRYRFAHLPAGAYAVAVYAHPWYTHDEGQRAFSDVFQILTNTPTDTLQKDVQSAPQIQEIMESLTSMRNEAGNIEIRREAGNIEIGSLGKIFDVVYPVTFFPNATRLADAARLSLAPGATEMADFQLRTVPSLHLRVNVPVEPATLSVTEEDGQEKENSAAQIDMSPDLSLSLRVGNDFSDQLSFTRTEIARGVVELSGIPPGQIDVLSTSFLNTSGGNYISRSKRLDVSGDTAIDLSAQGSSAIVSGAVLANQFSQVPQAPAASPVDKPAAEEVDKPAAQDQSDSEDGPPNFTVSFRSLQSGESYDTAVTGKGTFSFAASVLPEGSYEVELLGQPGIQVSSIEAQGARVSGRTIEIPSGQPVNLTVHTREAKCSLSGFAMKNGKPVAGAMVLLVPQDSGSGGPLYHRDQSDSDGSFALAPLFPGRYTLLAIENGWDLEWADPAVLFRYLPNGQQIEIPPDASVKHNAKVQ